MGLKRLSNRQGVLHDGTYVTVLLEMYMLNVCVDDAINRRLLPSIRAILLAVSTVNFRTSFEWRDNNPNTHSGTLAVRPQTRRYHFSVWWG